MHPNSILSLSFSLNLIMPRWGQVSSHLPWLLSDAFFLVVFHAITTLLCPSSLYLALSKTILSFFYLNAKWGLGLMYYERSALDRHTRYRCEYASNASFRWYCICSIGLPSHILTTFISITLLPSLAVKDKRRGCCFSSITPKSKQMCRNVSKAENLGLYCRLARGRKSKTRNSKATH